jgi:hypothetical protein
MADYANANPPSSCDSQPTRLAPLRALLKNEQDVHLFERLAFLSRREV